MSAGVPSSMQFALRYPDRSSALVLLVPATYAPQTKSTSQTPGSNLRCQLIFSSDITLWLAIKANRSIFLLPYSSLDRYPLERITVPTLIISASDDPYNTFISAQYTAQNIPGAKFIGLECGGHLLIEQEEKVRSEVDKFLKQHT
jgi:2-hydroxy-6-oxonona-2,4-dienedioate hydrolase